MDKQLLLGIFMTLCIAIPGTMLAVIFVPGPAQIPLCFLWGMFSGFWGMRMAGYS